ncbi:MAG: M10 family metallopeptidase C-terminal domain-containing protein [Planctomycetaceae bacterium]
MLNHKSWLTQLKQRLTNSSRPCRYRRLRRSGAEQLESRQLLAATPVGGEFLVNTTTAESQAAASMAMDADGDFVVAWTSSLQDGSITGVYAQRYDAAGVAQGGEFRVNTTTVNEQSLPAVAMDADGDFVIAWQSILQDGSDSGIYAQRYDSAGVAQGGEFRVNTTVTNGQGLPAVAMDADGNFIVTWQSFDQDGDGSGVYSQRYDSAGITQGGEFRVNTFTTSTQTRPVVAMDADGDFVVAWESYAQDSSGFGVYAKRYNAAGVTQGSEFRVNTTVTERQASPAVAMDADGDFVVAWESLQDGISEDVYAQRYDSVGAPLGGEFRVNTTTVDSQDAPAVAMDADGDFVVTWRSYAQDADGSDIHVRRYNAAGVAQGGELQVNTETADEQEDSSVAMDADGDFVVTWESLSQDGSSFGIYGQRFNETTFTAGPTVTEVRDLERQIAPGGQLSTTLHTLMVVFSEDMNVSGGASGANSVLNLANWQFAQDGVNVSSLITGITFELNSETNKYEAELTLGASLTSGTFQLTVLDSVRSVTGNSLDGDVDGTPGGYYQHVFAMTNVQAAGSEFRVNTYTPTEQYDSSVAMDADGDFVVTWYCEAQSGSGDDIYAQRFDSAGVPIGAEFRVNTVTAGSQLHSSIAMDADGDFVVTWQSTDQDGSGLSVHAQRFDSAGVAQGAEFRVNTFTTDDQAFPSVAMNAVGDFVVTWQSDSQDGSDTGIYAKRYTAAGVVQGLEFRVNTFTANAQVAPDVAMDADGDFVVTWTSNNQDGAGYGSYAKRYNSAGLARGSEFRVNTTTVGNQGDTSVAIADDGDFVIAWTSNGQDGSGFGIYAQRYNATGLKEGGEFRVNTFTPGMQRAPSVAMDADGDFVVSWESQIQDGDGFGIYAQRYNTAGVTQGGEFRVNTFTKEGQLEPSIAMNAAGDFVVTWESEGQENSGYGIYAQRYRSDAPVQLNSGVLSLTGSNFADEMSIERVAPAGAAVSLKVARNGVNYSIDATKVNNIEMNGLNGNDQLSIDRLVSTTAALNGDGGNDTLIGGVANDILNGGTGDDVYVFDTDLASGSDIITDVSGIETLDYSQTASTSLAVNLGLNTTQVVNANLSLTLASGNSIENVIGGSLGDTLTGNARPNRLTGGEGDDILTGAAGNDTYVFDADLILGADTIDEAGGGADTIDFSATTTRNLAINLSNAAVQTVAPGSLTLNLSAVNTIENVMGGTLNDSITGNSLANVLTGGLGNDVYFFDTDTALGTDRIQDTGGLDTLNFGGTTAQSIAVDLSGTAAQVVTASRLTLQLSSNAIENVIGGSLGDTLTGNSLANTLTGGGGNDTLAGAAGNDVYLFDSDLALASDTINDASGIDTLDFSATTTRGVTANLANAASQVINLGLSLTLSSATSIENMIGGALGDTLTGNTLANVFTGGPGNDTLTGGAGDDSYLFAANVNLGADTINEAGGGVDTLDFSSTTTQAISVNLSNAASQVVNPTLSLTLSAGNTIEKLIGGSLNDTLTGNTLDNVLTGGGGNDTLTGAAGNDTYLFNTDLVLGGDTINESGGGADTLDFSGTLNSSVSVNLATAGLQTVTSGRLTLTLSAVDTLDNVIGGALGDTLAGNSLSNRFTGGGGNDLLTGRAGNDVYVFDTDVSLGSDTINEADGGVDILDFRPTSTRAVVVDLSLAVAQAVNAGLTLNLSSSSTIENVLGGMLNDIVTGNTLSNNLTGGSGDDVLKGGSGNDVYVFDTDLALGSDTIVESGVGIDTLDFASTTTQRIEVELSLATSQVINSELTLTLSAANTIENVIGGSLSDILIGNSLANTLTGNGGDDVLAGRAGNDTLVDSAGKNILIGGDGADTLTGGSGEDLLLGARCIYENDFAALDSLLSEWTSASLFTVRVGHLQGTVAGGVHNGFTLTRSTVKEDSSADTLIGGNGQDWYLRNSLGSPSIFRDTTTESNLDSVFTEIDTWF